MLLNRMNDQQRGGKKHTGEISLENVDSDLSSGKNHLCEVTTWTKVFQALLMLPNTHILESY